MTGFTTLFVHLTITISYVCLDQFQCIQLSDFFVLLDILFHSKKQLTYGHKNKEPGTK